jgi:hypothetical protein
MEVILTIPDTKMRKTDPVKRREEYMKRREQILIDLREKYRQDPFKMRVKHQAYYQAHKEQIRAKRLERMRLGLLPGTRNRNNKSSAPRDYFPRKPETVETVRALPLFFKEASFSVSFD